MAQAPRLRPHGELAADRAACRAYQSPSRTDFEQGAIDAYDWLLGRGPAPLGGPAAAGPGAVEAQEQLADDAVRGRPGAPTVSRADSRWTESYVAGVRAALRWARYASPAAPGGYRGSAAAGPAPEAGGTDTGGPAAGTSPVVGAERRPPRYRRTWEG